MKLRRRSLRLQLLFAAAVPLAALCQPSPSFSQTVPGAGGPHRVTTRDGRTSSAEILGVKGNAAELKVGSGTISVPLANIVAVEMAPPPGVAAAAAALAARDYPKALAETNALATKFRGLPAPWARDAAANLGDIYVALGKIDEAEAAYNAFAKAYPGQAGLRTAVGMARVDFARKRTADAKAKLEPVAAEALKLPVAPEDKAAAFSQAFLLLGEIAEAENDLPAALENYLRTVTLFYHHAPAVAAAQDKADALRKANPGLTAP